jgi:3-deoxy-D-manno-octulosonic-acid transferase
MENFAEIANAFLTNSAAVQVRTARDLEEVVVELMADPVRRARLGAAARALVDANRGVKDTTLRVLAELLPPDRPAVVRPFRVIH